MDDPMTAAMIGITILALLPACCCDIRYRTVPNGIWWALGATGLFFLFGWTLDGREFHWHYALPMAGTVLILLYMLLFEIGNRAAALVLYATMAACFAVPCMIDFDEVARTYLVIGITFAIVMLLYVTGILRGGADAKCAMMLGFMFPVCPAFGCFPLIPVPGSAGCMFPFAVAVLFHAALFALLYLFAIVLRKLWRTDSVRMVNLSCYIMSIKEARRSHVWAKQDVRDGMVVNVDCIPDDGVYDRLEAAGAKTVWVTPIVPFIVPMAIAAVFVLFVGNLLFIPFG